jgi:hypothetical protein
LLSDELEELKKDHNGFLAMLFSLARGKGIALDKPPQYMRHAWYRAAPMKG